MAWQHSGLQAPEKVTLATGEYREEMDVLADFMEELCIVGPGQYVSMKDLYLVYAQWCDELRQRPQNYRLFNRQLKERNYHTAPKRTNGTVKKSWVGLGLKKEAAPNTFMQLKEVDNGA